MEYRVVSRRAGEGMLAYRDIDAGLLARFRLIINTTPLGMAPDVGTLPDLPYEGITDRHLLYDLVYNPEKTLFLAQGTLRGAHIKNGLEMLHLQAMRAWEIWNQ